MYFKDRRELLFYTFRTFTLGPEYIPYRGIQGIYGHRVYFLNGVSMIPESISSMGYTWPQSLFPQVVYRVSESFSLSGIWDPRALFLRGHLGPQSPFP